MNARRAKDLLVTLQHQWEHRTHSGKMYRRADGITWPSNKRPRTSARDPVSAPLPPEIPAGANGNLNPAAVDSELDWMLMTDGDLLAETCDRDIFGWDPTSVMFDRET